MYIWNVFQSDVHLEKCKNKLYYGWGLSTIEAIIYSAMPCIIRAVIIISFVNDRFYLQ
jgi:hypothetical protein